MNSLKFLHCADIHLDSPLRGLERYEGAPVDEVRSATRRALSNLIDLAIAERVALVLIAGDLFDGDWPDFNTGLFFVKAMARLNEAHIPVYMVRGNHDAQSRIAHQLPLPPNVCLFAADGPQTEVNEALGIAVHGQSFARPAITEDLAQAFPAPVQDLLNIGLLHTSVTGRPGHATYAPCRLETLVAKGYDYWALGHIHQREILSRDPWVVFPGNLQGRHIREIGAKGCELVTVEDGIIRSVRPIALDVLRWQWVSVDAGGYIASDDILLAVRQSIQSLLATEADGRTLALRVRIHGTTPAHQSLSGNREAFIAQIRAMAIDVPGGTIWVEKVLVETESPHNRDALLAREDPVGDLARLLRDLDAEPERVVSLWDHWSDFVRRLPPEISGDQPFWEDADMLRRILRAVENRLIPALLEEGETTDAH